jgi:hypothetical protein
MKLAKILAASVAMSALTAVVVTPTVAVAQQVTSSVRGTVVDGSGAPVGGATVTITDSRTGTSRTVRTSANGQFQIANLEVGGPYEVRVGASGYQSTSVENVVVDLGNRTTLRIALTSGVSDEVVVVASRSVQSDLAIGPNNVFGLDKLTELPSIGRDFRDIIRIDPRVRIDATNQQAVSCLGTNNRFNTFTIDGVRNGDALGLNASGFQNRRGIPIPFDGIRETSVEFAPFDVQYGQFTGCALNVVTKSGSNEFSGSAFAVFNNQTLTGSTLEGRNVNTTPFRDYNWGATLGGPIIKDKLFFFAAYEETIENESQDFGPNGGGFANEASFASVAQVEAIAAALEARGIPTGGIANIRPRDSRRILARGDWNITDNHRLAFTYQRLFEQSTIADDQSINNRQLILGNTFYTSGTRSQTYSARLFSQWTDNLSTEIRASRANINDLQDPVGGGEAQSGNPIPRVFVGVGTGAVIAGPGFSRQANAGEFQIDQIRAKADYTAGEHTFTFGYDFDSQDTFNLFAQNATGTLVFKSLTDLQNGILSDGANLNFNGTNIQTAGLGGPVGASFQNSFTGDINDAAANFTRTIHSLFVQDSWQVTDALTALIGLRYDFYKSGDAPRFNNRFFQRYGFANDQGFDGLHAWLPRFGLTYEAGETFAGSTTFRLGAGVFSGGDPTVWYSNAFSNSGNLLSGNTGIRTTLGFTGTCTAADLNLGPVGDLAIPTCLQTAAQNFALAADGRADAIDPNLKLPTVIRSNFGFTHNTDFGGALGGFFDDWTAQIDVIYTRGRNNYDVVDLSLTQVATGIDGRPIYRHVDPLNAGCTATFLGIRQGFSGVTAPCFTAGNPPGGRDTILLTNALQGDKSFSVSGVFSKDFEFASPFNPRTSEIDVQVGYAYNDAKDSFPGTSSVSLSNFRNLAAADIGAFPLATSNYEIAHNATFNLTWREEFLPDMISSFGFFFSARSGQPYSLTFRNGAFFESGGTQRALLYIPTGPTDPNVTFGGGFDQAAFFSFLEAIGADKYAGQIAPRNAFKSDWVLDLDFRYSQQLPLIANKVRPTFFIDIENLANFFTDEANILRQVGFPYAANIVGVSSPTIGSPGATYTYTSFVPAGAVQQINTDASIWRAQVGLRFEF